MALTDLKIKAIKVKPKRYLVSDGDGLNLEILPSGKKSWVYRYRVNGKPEKMWLGRYGKHPDMTLQAARIARDGAKSLVNKEKSPIQEKKQAKAEHARAVTVKDFGKRFFDEQIKRDWKNPVDFRRYLDEEIFPKLGDKLVKDVTPLDILNIVFGKRDRGAPAAARQMRTLLKQLFDYAVTNQIREFNPVLSIPAKDVAKLEARTRSLSPEEIRRFLQALYGSTHIRRQLQLSLHLILLTLVRKSELLRARWEHVKFETGEWTIPPGHAKNGREHIVYLSSQALELFRELQALAGGSALVLPGRLSLKQPYSRVALNEAIDRLESGIEPFTVHDLRRTASTILHEKDFPSDVIELALNHALPGMRGVYNKAKYAEQRKKMLQFWGDFVDGLASEKKVLVGNFMRA